MSWTMKISVGRRGLRQWPPFPGYTCRENSSAAVISSAKCTPAVNCKNYSKNWLHNRLLITGSAVQLRPGEPNKSNQIKNRVVHPNIFKIPSFNFFSWQGKEAVSPPKKMKSKARKWSFSFCYYFFEFFNAFEHRSCIMIIYFPGMPHMCPNWFSFSGEQGPPFTDRTIDHFIHYKTVDVFINIPIFFIAEH